MVCAVIDATHIEIIAPRHNENQANYFSRLNKHTVSTQIILAANLIIFGVAPCFSGSCHDATVCRETEICQQIEAAFFLSFYYGHNSTTSKIPSIFWETPILKITNT